MRKIHDSNCELPVKGRKWAYVDDVALTTDVAEVMGSEIETFPNAGVGILVFNQGASYSFKFDGVLDINNGGRLTLAIRRPIRVVEI